MAELPAVSVFFQEDSLCLCQGCAHAKLVIGGDLRTSALLASFAQVLPCPAVELYMDMGPPWHQY